jgi:DMSO/TMAO reductase YedYZ molybdopterin-dependent catalytic subunit
MNRRTWLSGLGASLGGIWLSGCDQIAKSPTAAKGLAVAEGVNRKVQRLFIGRTGLAREFDRKHISSYFKANGNTDPATPEYKAHLDAGFADWKLVVDGLVNRPLALSLTDLKALPARTQITRHDCVEGWSSIGEWTGAKLGAILDQAGLKPNARYLVFHCFDQWGANGEYYESIDLNDARHPQSILAYTMNGQPLPVAHGAPIRLRVERQLGYKHAKYIKRIEAVESFKHLGGGKGGFWEDQGYEWYAGI